MDSRKSHFSPNTSDPLGPVYTEELPGVFAHDSLFVLVRPGVALRAQSRARAQNYPTQRNKQRIVRGYSWQLLSVDWPLCAKGTRHLTRSARNGSIQRSLTLDIDYVSSLESSFMIEIQAQAAVEE